MYIRKMVIYCVNTDDEMI